MITQARLKEVLHYDGEKMIWIAATANQTKLGSVAGYKRSDGYIYITIEGKKYMSHRLIWLYVHGELPPVFTDHINGIRDDNRIENLRVVSALGNARNKKNRKDNSSGFCGVGWSAKQNRWLARITADAKLLHLGSFSPDFEGKMMALAARKNAEEKYGYHQNHGRAA